MLNQEMKLMQEICCLSAWLTKEVGLSNEMPPYELQSSGSLHDQDTWPGLLFNCILCNTLPDNQTLHPASCAGLALWLRVFPSIAFTPICDKALYYLARLRNQENRLPDCQSISFDNLMCTCEELSSNGSHTGIGVSNPAQQKDKHKQLSIWASTLCTVCSYALQQRDLN